MSWGHSFKVFHSCNVLLLLCLSTCNKTVNFIGFEDFYLDLLFPYVFVSVHSTDKASYLVENPVLDLQSCSSIKPIAALYTPTRNRKDGKKDFFQTVKMNCMQKD